MRTFEMWGGREPEKEIYFWHSCEDLRREEGRISFPLK